MTSSGTLARAGVPSLCGASSTLLLAGSTAQPSGPLTRTSTRTGRRLSDVAATWTAVRTCEPAPGLGSTTSCVGDIVADSERLGVSTGTAAVSALSALAWVRQSNTLGLSAVDPPAQRRPSRSEESRSFAQTVSACRSTNAW